MPTKAIWASKTIWLNVLSVVAMLLGAPEQIGLAPDKAVLILGVVNVLLRWLGTSQPVTLTGGPVQP